MRREGRTGTGTRTGRGFTLIELMIVILVIGILIGFILTAAMGGVRRAEERATQSLIAKLESGLSDRLDALLTTRASPTAIHQQLASLYGSGGVLIQSPTDPYAASARAQVWAQYDLMRAEVPDVFTIPGSKDTDANSSYPINFASHLYSPAGSILPGFTNSAFLPLGAPIDPVGNNTVPVIGANGASFTVAAGLYKNAGYRPFGYDGIDNDGNGLIDDTSDGTADTTGTSLTLSTALGAHTHNTARAEMLYALLVEGQGPLGSTFNVDDFTQNEVQDTDGDGLPEFVDAWGQPLQFFRWPVYYNSPVQKGINFQPSSGTLTVIPPYNGAIEAREQDPLDPNQQLVAPAWWSNGGTTNQDPTGSYAPINISLGFTGSSPLSAGAVAFQHFFHSLIDPGVTATSLNNWDRNSATASNIFKRRAYYTKFLILSGGPDLTPGVFLYSDATLSSATGVVDFLMEESKALPCYILAPTTPNAAIPSYSLDTSTHGQDLLEAGNDDITNHNLQAAGGSLH